MAHSRVILVINLFVCHSGVTLCNISSMFNPYQRPTPTPTPYSSLIFYTPKLHPKMSPLYNYTCYSSGSRGPRGNVPRPVKNSHIKDGRQVRWLMFYVSCPPLSDVSGSATWLMERIGTQSAHNAPDSAMRVRQF